MARTTWEGAVVNKLSPSHLKVINEWRTSEEEEPLLLPSEIAT